jgi:hypothetical protein
MTSIAIGCAFVYGLIVVLGMHTYTSGKLNGFLSAWPKLLQPVIGFITALVFPFIVLLGWRVKLNGDRKINEMLALMKTIDEQVQAVMHVESKKLGVPSAFGQKVDALRDGARVAIAKAQWDNQESLVAAQRYLDLYRSSAHYYGCVLAVKLLESANDGKDLSE